MQKIKLTNIRLLDMLARMCLFIGTEAIITSPVSLAFISNVHQQEPNIT